MMADNKKEIRDRFDALEERVRELELHLYRRNLRLLAALRRQLGPDAHESESTIETAVCPWCGNSWKWPIEPSAGIFSTCPECNKRLVVECIRHRYRIEGGRMWVETTIDTVGQVEEEV